MWIFERTEKFEVKDHSQSSSLNNEYIKKEKKKISLSIGDVRSQNELC